MNIFKETAGFFLLAYPSLRGAPRPASLPSISADDSSSKLGSSICQDMRKSSATHPLQTRITATPLSARGVDPWVTSPHQRTVEFDGGYAWVLSAPGSSSSGLPGWCWFLLIHSPASQMWPAKQKVDLFWLYTFIFMDKCEHHICLLHTNTAAVAGTTALNPISVLKLLHY